MAANKNIAGVVLAGGRSSRMKRDKAFLEYDHVPLVDYMSGLLKETGLEDVFVSGDLEGYRCIPDSAPHTGPARAICDVLKALKTYEAVLFVPVDMPFLAPAILRILLEQPQGAYFKNYALPAFIKNAGSATSADSVRGLLHALDVPAIHLPDMFEPCMKNLNTPEDWQEALRA